MNAVNTIHFSFYGWFSVYSARTRAGVRSECCEGHRLPPREVHSVVSKTGKDTRNKESEMFVTIQETREVLRSLAAQASNPVAGQV